MTTGHVHDAGDPGAPPRDLGHYVVEKELGRGGMGVVYLARDRRLDRRVAIKTLPAELARDPEQLGRFEREAKLLASLNHPNIATIHGLEETDDSTRYLILEFVEGDTLASRLVRGAMPFDEAVAVCQQVAEALEAAHEQGVVHRDLKPRNIMITPGGRVKVLDFGLAKRAIAERADGVQASMLTEPGMMMGTPGYMSPEQVLAQPQDKRTDVFAFGCVLYECLCGRKVFDADNVPGMIALVLGGEPDWGALPGESPAGVRDLLAACLQKDPDLRPSEMKDVRIRLTGLLREHESGGRTISAIAGVLHNLPREVTTFVGRKQELEACSQLFGQTRLLTLTGSGGSGKTRLALRLGTDLLDQHPGGVWFVDLAPLADASRVPQAVAAALQVREEPGKSLDQTLIGRLRLQKTLLMLDNCEHVLTSCATLALTLLQGCEHLKVVATSREALGVAGEQVYGVPTLEVPRSNGKLSAETASEFASVRLFVERAGQVQPGFALSDQSAPIVAEICRRLDGIPLAIELAAARVKVLAVEQIRAKLDDRFRLLTGGSKAGLPRQQTLRATIQWSVDQLHDDERRLMAALGVFAGGWTLEAATAVCGVSEDEFEVLDLLTRLVDKSLVMVERPRGGEPRYRYLESVRQFALEKLAETPDGASLRERYAGYYSVLAEREAPRLSGPDQPTALRTLDAEHDNLLGALLGQGGSPSQGESALHIGSSIWRYWLARGQLTLGRTQLRELLAQPGPDSVFRARALYGCGVLTYYQGDYDAARGCFEQSLAVHRTGGDGQGVAAALGGLGVVAMDQADYAAARQWYDQALATWREIGDQKGMAHTLNNLGVVCMRQGDLEAALELYQEARDVLKQSGDKTNLVLTLENLAMLSGRGQDAPALRRYLIESLELLQEMGSQQPVAVALESSAELAMLVGQPARAATLLGAADALRRAIEMTAEPGHVEELKRLRTAAEQALGPPAFQVAWERGERLTFESAVTETLAWLREEAIASPGPGA